MQLYQWRVSNNNIDKCRLVSVDTDDQQKGNWKANTVNDVQILHFLWLVGIAFTPVMHRSRLHILPFQSNQSLLA